MVKYDLLGTFNFCHLILFLGFNPFQPSKSPAQKLFIHFVRLEKKFEIGREFKSQAANMIKIPGIVNTSLFIIERVKKTVP